VEPRSVAHDPVALDVPAVMQGRSSRAVVAALVVAVAALTGAAPTQAGVVLREVTTIAGTQAGWVDVELPQTIRATQGEPPFTVTWTGPGALKGVHLRAEEGLHSITAMSNQDGAPSSSYGDTLPAGSYRLYLITAGDLLDVHLRLPALAGTGTNDLAIEHSILVEGGSFASATRADGRVVAGRGVRLQTHGMVWYRSGYSFPEGVYGEAEQCGYLPGNEHDRPDQFDKGCPGTSQVATPGGLASGTTVGSGGAGDAEAGSRWAFGGNARSYYGGPPTVFGEVYAINLALAVQPAPFPYPAGSPYATPEADRPGPPPQDTSAPHPEPAEPTPSLPRATVPARAARWALVPVRCTGAQACRGTVSAGTTPVRFRVAAGATAIVAVPLTLADRRRLRARRPARPIVRVVIGRRLATMRRTTVRPTS
jgi:hypothetical protein